MAGTRPPQNPKDGTQQPSKRNGRYITLASSTSLLSHYRVPLSSLFIQARTLPLQAIFSWPQVSCMEASPVRGSRVVFVQKFVMRFLAFSDSQAFMCFLKENLKDIRNVGPPSSKLGSDVSPPSEFISANGIYGRGAEKLSNANPVGSSKHPIRSSSTIGSLQYTCLEATALAHDSEAAWATLPLSFSALLSDSCMEAKQESPTVPMTHGSQMMSSSNNGRMQYTYPEATKLSHDSGAKFVTLRSSISAHLSGFCTEAKQGLHDRVWSYDRNFEMGERSVARPAMDCTSVLGKLIVRHLTVEQEDGVTVEIHRWRCHGPSSPSFPTIPDGNPKNLGPLFYTYTYLASGLKKELAETCMFDEAHGGVPIGCWIDWATRSIVGRLLDCFATVGSSWRRANEVGLELLKALNWLEVDDVVVGLTRGVDRTELGYKKAGLVKSTKDEGGSYHDRKRYNWRLEEIDR
ncbi:unnamed protein product [Dovyalis caffra]|uniref:Poor homologous synapsis 1 PH domain-containing protein n=1 Tax=Dovyalis caffra TaxID=77055 RepID=A0AAV1R6G7_9ROSI|nr:unnamed protein product [Dovyalis caffra]